jgi:hypothetical protein
MVLAFIKVRGRCKRVWFRKAPMRMGSDDDRFPLDTELSVTLQLAHRFGFSARPIPGRGEKPMVSFGV